HRQHDECLGALRDEAVDVAELLLGRAAGIGADVRSAGLGELLLDGLLVGLPALFLEIRPAHSDDGLGLGREGRGTNGRSGQHMQCMLAHTCLLGAAEITWVNGDGAMDSEAARGGPSVLPGRMAVGSTMLRGPW